MEVHNQMTTKTIAKFTTIGILLGIPATLFAVALSQHPALSDRNILVAMDPIQLPAMLITGQLEQDGPTLWLEDLSPESSAKPKTRPYSGEPVRVGTTEVQRFCWHHRLATGGTAIVCDHEPRTE